MSLTEKPFTRSEQPLGTGRDHRRRLLYHHLPLALASTVAFVLWMTVPIFQPARHEGEGHGASHQGGGGGGGEAGHHRPPQGSGGHSGHAMGGSEHQFTGDGERQARMQERLFLARVTTGTGYIALGLLAFTLLIGPANLVLRRRNPVSSYLRRDAGAWTAVVSVVHVVVGLQLHGPPTPATLGERVLRYFFAADGTVLANAFGLANWTGLAATVIVVGLLAVSSDFALRNLAAKPWKWLQRLNYALFVLVVAHAVFYGALLRVTSPSTLLLGFIVAAVLGGQIMGFQLWRRRHARTAATVTTALVLVALGASSVDAQGRDTGRSERATYFAGVSGDWTLDRVTSDDPARVGSGHGQAGPQGGQGAGGHGPGPHGGGGGGNWAAIETTFELFRDVPERFTLTVNDSVVVTTWVDANETRLPIKGKAIQLTRGERRVEARTRWDAGRLRFERRIDAGGTVVDIVESVASGKRLLVTRSVKGLPWTTPEIRLVFDRVR